MKEQRKKLKKYILPAMLSNVSFFILTIFDGIFVGNGVGTDALGAVNLAMPFVMLVQAVAVLFSIGGVAVASVRLGRGDDEGANIVFLHVTLAITVIFGILTIAGTVFSDQIAALLGANETFQQMVSDYIFWYSVFLIPVGLLTGFSAFCRNDGEPLLCTAGAVAGVVINIFGDWFLVFPMQMGVSGAAMATGASSFLSMLIIFMHFFLKRGRLHFGTFKINIQLYQKILMRGVPEMVSQFAAPITTFSMNRMLLSYIGDAGINTYSVIGYASSLFSSLMYGMSAGLQPLFGISYGAKDEKSLHYYFKSGIRISGIGGIFVFIATFFIGKPICVLFGADPAIYSTVAAALPMYCANYIFAAVSTVIAAYLFSTKRTSYALVLNFSRSMLCNFLCINFLPLVLGKESIWYALAVSEGIALVIGIFSWKSSEKNGIIYK